MTIPVHLDFEASIESFPCMGFEFELDGVRGWKMADDLLRYKYAIDRSNPDVIVETGTKWGGTALWFSHHVPEVITIDIDERLSTVARAKSTSNIRYLIGNSTSVGVIRRVRELTVGKRVMVSLDSNHIAHHVAQEIDAYGRLVSPGCYLVVEDGIFDLMGREGDRLVGQRVTRFGGALKAIELKLVGSPQWIRDEEVEQLTSITHSPAGWWRRV